MRKLRSADKADLQGTTGQPKGATLTHHNVLNNAYFIGIRAGYHEQVYRFSRKYYGRTAEITFQKTIICIPNPLYHCFGCVMGVLSALTHLQTCVFPAPSFEALAALQAIDEERYKSIYREAGSAAGVEVSILGVQLYMALRRCLLIC